MVDDELDEAILENATGPARASGDSGSVDQHPLPDQITVAKYRAARTAVARPHRGLYFTKLVPPGAV